MQYQAVKGTLDVTPKESYKWQYAEGIIRELCGAYGFQEARTPVIEYTELFLRGVGDTTDIVQKEMYTFEDKGGRSITLKPEGTAGAARMFIEKGLFNDAQPTKMYYLNCPVFRYDKPQAGRYREHHQFGVEVYGAPRASADAECIALAMALFRRMGLRDLTVYVNSIGCPGCRSGYNAALKGYLRANFDGLCETCRGRFEKNPLRILDCKEERCGAICAGAPSILDCLCGDCSAHFEELKGCLSALSIPFQVNPRIVRGLDYYTKTVFEVFSDKIGSQGAICGGGRYDGLVEELGGPSIPAVGFGMGIERVLMLLEEGGGLSIEEESPEVFVACLNQTLAPEAFVLMERFRAAGLRADMDHQGRSLKAQFKYADKLGARHIAIVGEDEFGKGVTKLRDMASREEWEAPLESAAAMLKERMAKKREG